LLAWLRRLTSSTLCHSAGIKANGFPSTSSWAAHLPVSVCASSSCRVKPEDCLLDESARCCWPTSSSAPESLIQKTAVRWLSAVLAWPGSATCRYARNAVSTGESMDVWLRVRQAGWCGIRDQVIIVSCVSAPVYCTAPRSSCLLRPPPCDTRRGVLLLQQRAAPARGVYAVSAQGMLRNASWLEQRHSAAGRGSEPDAPA